ncbi:uncharacterized protein LOC119092568 [Pollicipes pollicipes]|uniref:uncharacterized protein LOC119092568 n=1 Tax=Pollicipes pollicipes TaxID=41117 RepID=UPI001884F59E|nr:uncharacterized protein LOC119092568 [Pollicipes pollicipes]
MVRMRRCPAGRCSMLFALLALAALLMLIRSAHHRLVPDVVPNGRLLESVQHIGLATGGTIMSEETEDPSYIDAETHPVTPNGLTASGVTEERFDLGPDPFDDRLRQEVLRNLTLARVRQAAASGQHSSDVIFDPVLGTVMHKADMQQYFDVLRTRARERNRPANASEVECALAQLRRQLSEELRQLPPDGLARRQHRPRAVFLVTTWRSGSTFLGHVLSSHPGVFTHYEPLLSLGVRQARAPEDVRLAHHTLRRLRDCRYDGLPAYMNATRHSVEDVLSHNPRVWRACQLTNRNVCTNETFLGDACRLLPLHLFKLVRLRLRELERYVRSGEARVLYLLRDPRATLSSRLSSRLAARPEHELRRIFDFVGFDWTTEVERVVRETTQAEGRNEPWSVQKKSAQHVNRWKQRLTSKQLSFINRKCKGVINELHNLNPGH